MKQARPVTDTCPGLSAPLSCEAGKIRSCSSPTPRSLCLPWGAWPPLYSLGGPSCPSFPAGSQGPSAALPSPKSFISSTPLAVSGSWGACPWTPRRRAPWFYLFYLRQHSSTASPFHLGWSPGWPRRTPCRPVLGAWGGEHGFPGQRPQPPEAVGDRRGTSPSGPSLPISLHFE